MQPSGSKRVVSLCLLSVCACAQDRNSSSSPSPTTSYRTVLDRYCATCHSEKLHTAGLVLSKTDLENVGEGAQVWEKVIGKLRTGAMPPPGVPQPRQATTDALVKYLEAGIDRAAAAKPNPGRPSVHRLNRAEYANAIRDLLSLEIDSESLLPPDDSGYGFDNIGEVLSVSPTLLEKYMAAAGKISRLSVGDRTTHPITETYSVSKLLKQDDRMSEDLPFGSRGGIAVKHDFPLDGQYVIKITLQRNARSYIRGLAESNLLDVRLDEARIKLFTIGGEHKGDSWVDLYSNVNLIDPDQQHYELTADEGLEVRFPSKAGVHVVQVAFLQESRESEAVLAINQIPDFDRYQGGNPAVDSVAISGPYDATGLGETSSRKKIFVCHPTGTKDEEPCARKILATLARHAYRRPVTDGDVQTLLSFYKSGANKRGFEAGIGMALRRMLVEPDFLFRIERDPANVAPDTPYRVSDLALASRLSFFLWSSIPDDELLDLAQRGKLSEPAVLEQQVRRMLADSRSSALVTNFAGQWLYLRNLRLVSPDPEAFPDFDDNLREAFQRETELFFESMLRENRSVLDLLTANYTFVSERLAQYYGIPNVYGSRFRRVTLNDDARGGLLGQGSILTVTSYATRTSPTLRGKWLLENILGAPPPPPPANVPSLKDRGSDGRILSVRQQMELHRADPACASCHARMDPLGFALENFDAIGRWRTTSGEDATPIDASGVLPDGTKFVGPVELRKILLKHPAEFATTVTEKLLTYALGRGLEYYDAPTVRKITQNAAPSNYRWSSLILEIVKSTPFQMRRSAEGEFARLR